MSQPKWRAIGAGGDVNILEYGGYVVYRDTTHVYDPECLHVVPPPDDAQDGPYTVYRFALEQIKRVTVDDRIYIVPIGYRADWPHPIARYRPWYIADRDRPQDSRLPAEDETRVIDELCSDDPCLRARGYETIGEYFGYENLDSYPRQLPRAEVRKQLPRRYR